MLFLRAGQRKKRKIGKNSLLHGLKFFVGAYQYHITWVEGHDEFTLPTETERRANKRNYEYTTAL